MVRKGNPETLVMKEITDRLESLGYPLAGKGLPGAVVRMNVGPCLKAGGRIGKNPLKGFPDLMVFLRSGRVAVIEVKRPDTGDVTPEQKAWLSYLAERKVVCLVARSADYVEQWITLAERGIQA